MVDEPGGTGLGPSSLASQPNVNTSRCGGSSSTNSPRAVWFGITSQRKMPPARGSSSARMPIQRVIFASSTRNSQTVSGRAAIAISRSTVVVSAVLSTMLPLLSFGLPLERGEAIAPELLQECLQLRQPLGSRAVQPPHAVAPLVHQTGLLEHAEVLRDRRPADVEVCGDLARRQLLVPDEAEDLPPVRLGDGLQRRVHRIVIAFS